MTTPRPQPSPLSCAARVFPWILVASLIATPAWAVEFDWSDARLNLDATFSLGANVRVEKRAPDLLGVKAGGTNPLAENIDDGNINFGPGPSQGAARAIVDAEFKYKDFAAFVRANGFFDAVTFTKTELAPESRRFAGWDAQVLDAYVRYNASVWDRPLSLRAGYQVINWGETIFFGGGVNAVNGIDLRRLRVPGAELRDAYLPSPMLYVAFEPVTNLSVEAFVNAKSTYVRLEACGTLFAPSDVLCEGTPKPIDIGQPISVSRSADDRVDGWFQRPEYGVALKYTTPEALNSTQFALYFMNHHNKAPMFGARAPPIVPGVPTALAIYPSDIKMYGFSFSTNFPGTGLTLSGEYSHRPQQPLQTSLATLLATALPAGINGTATPNQLFDASIKLPVGQASLSLLKEFGRTFLADNLVALVEFCGTKIWRMPSGGIILDGPGKVGSFAWGYEVLVNADYYNVFRILTVSPSIAFFHNAMGNFPTGGNFIQDRNGLNVGVTVAYLNRVSGTVSYSGFFGAGASNVVRDKDFMSFVVSYAL